jgi:uncharacterized protein (UPF0276 family)
LGLGAGWRSQLARAIDCRPDLGFVEALAEDLVSGPLPVPLQRLRERGVRIVPHAIGLSLGGAELPDLDRVADLARLAERVQAPLVSEHLSFVRAGGLESGHLLPLPRTGAALEVVVENVREVKRALPVPLALENVSTLFEWPGAEMDEPAFLAEVLERADVLLLLDLENVYANARNHGFDAAAFLDRIPLQRIAYIHIAGGCASHGLFHDTHTYPTPAPVLDLLESLYARVEGPGVMLERDGRYPPDEQWHAEMDAIAAAVARGRARREEWQHGARTER